MALWLTTDDEANRILDTDPFALLVGMTLDQQCLRFWKHSVSAVRGLEG